MIITEYDNPSPHIIIDDFLDQDSLDKVKKEIIELTNKSQPGELINPDGSRTVNEEIKKNKIIWLDQYYEEKRDKSDILKEVIGTIWSTPVIHFLNKTRSGIFRLYKLTNSDHTLFSIYKNNDFYKKHEDTSTNNQSLFLTSVLMIKLNGDFKGGELVLGEKEIEFKSNRLVIFESHRLHSVNKIITDENPDNWRYTIQYWATIK